MAGEAKEEYPPLLPLGFHRMSLLDVHNLCVVPFPRSATRAQIMSGLEVVVERLNMSRLRLEVWINGSFLTQKLDPDDSDIAVRFWGHELDAAGPDQLQILQWAAGADPKANHRCHCFPFPEYPNDHDLHDFGQWRRAYWLKQFGYSRQEEPKGLAVLGLPFGAP